MNRTTIERSVKPKNSFLAYIQSQREIFQPEVPVSRSKNLRTVERKRSLHFHVYLPTFVPRSKKIFASSLEIPNLCIMPPMIKYSPACKSKSRRENPTSHIYVYTRTYTCTYADDPLLERRLARRRGSVGNQNAKLFGFQLHGISEYPGRRQVDIPGYLETRRKNVPPREISSPKMACLPNRVAIYNIPKDHPAFPITRKGRTYYTVIRRATKKILFFFSPFFPPLSNGERNKQFELERASRTRSKLQTPNPRLHPLAISHKISADNLGNRPIAGDEWIIKHDGTRSP